MTEQEINNAIKNKCPVIAITGLYGELEYKRILSIVCPTDSQDEMLLELESTKGYQGKRIIYPARMVRLKI